MRLPTRTYSASAALVLALFVSGLVSLQATALEMEVVSLDQIGCTTDPTYPHCFGSTVTIGLRVSNESGQSVSSLGITATGHRLVASFVSGEAAGSVLNSVCDEVLGCFGGITNFASGVSDNAGSVRLFEGVTSGPTTSDGSIDPGLDGGPGTAQFLVSFQIVGAGIELISIGIDPSIGDVGIADGLQIDPASFNKQVVLSSEQPAYVVPEPTVGVLLGMGLASLAASTRNRRELDRARADSIAAKERA